MLALGWPSQLFGQAGKFEAQRTGQARGRPSRMDTLRADCFLLQTRSAAADGCVWPVVPCFEASSTVSYLPPLVFLERQDAAGPQELLLGDNFTEESPALAASVKLYVHVYCNLDTNLDLDCYQGVPLVDTLPVPFKQPNLLLCESPPARRLSVLYPLLFRLDSLRDWSRGLVSDLCSKTIACKA